MRNLLAAWLGLVALAWVAGGPKTAVTWGILSPFVWLGLWMLYSFVSMAKGVVQALGIGAGGGAIWVIAVALDLGIDPSGAAMLFAAPVIAAGLIWMGKAKASSL